jgi:hypothetical protein
MQTVPAENAFSYCWRLSPGLAGLALTCLDTPRLRQSVFQNSGIGTVGAAGRQVWTVALFNKEAYSGLPSKFRVRKRRGQNY